MALISLKISNVRENMNEFKQRLRGVQSPGKRALVNAIKEEDWEAIYKELLFRIELYTSQKVLNYTRQDLNNIVINSRKYGVEAVVAALMEKYDSDNNALFNSTYANSSLNESQNYQEFFKGKLEEYGVNSPADLDDEDKKKFFNEIEEEWDSQDELNESVKLDINDFYLKEYSKSVKLEVFNKYLIKIQKILKKNDEINDEDESFDAKLDIITDTIIEATDDNFWNKLSDEDIVNDFRDSYTRYFLSYFEIED